MFRAFFTTFVAASIFTCPLMCKLGKACCRTECAAAATKSCCHGCPSEAKGDSQAPPSDDSPGDCRHCVCGGAVIEKSSLVDLQLDTHWSLPAQFLYAVVATEGQSRVELFSMPALPDDGLNPGRALCRLFMSFQC